MMFTLSFIGFVLVSIVAKFSNIYAFPLNPAIVFGPDVNSSTQPALTNVTPTAPHFMVYGSGFYGAIGPPAASDIQGFNVFALSFLLLEGAWDKAYEWTTLTDAQRSSVKSQYAAAGIKLIVSVFGSSDVPTTTGADPVDTANTVGAWVKKYNLDGVDVDYEDLYAFDEGKGTAEAWLISFTKQLRIQLPQGSYILTHAPAALWFSPKRWGGGGYLKVHASVGDLIDWYNVQFYDQGTSAEYTTCTGLLTKSSDNWPQTALFEIASNGVPLDKLIIGTTIGASHISNFTLASCLKQAKNNGWNGGAMVWKYPASSWMTSIRSLSWPV